MYVWQILNAIEYIFKSLLLLPTQQIFQHCKLITWVYVCSITINLLLSHYKIKINNFSLYSLGDGVSFPQMHLNEDQEGLLHERSCEEEEMWYP